MYGHLSNQRLSEFDKRTFIKHLNSRFVVKIEEEALKIGNRGLKKDFVVWN